MRLLQDLDKPNKQNFSKALQPNLLHIDNIIIYLPTDSYTIQKRQKNIVNKHAAYDV